MKPRANRANRAAAFLRRFFVTEFFQLAENNGFAKFGGSSRWHRGLVQPVRGARPKCWGLEINGLLRRAGFAFLIE